MTIERLNNYRTIRIRLETDLSADERARLEKEKYAIDDFVNSIKDDYEIKSFIEMKYINGNQKVSWLSVALRHGYRSEHTPERKLRKFLKKAEMADLCNYN